MFCALVAFSARAAEPVSEEASDLHEFPRALLAQEAHGVPGPPAPPDPTLRVVLLDRTDEEAQAARFGRATVGPGQVVPCEAVLGSLSLSRVMELVPGLVAGSRMDRSARIVIDGADLASLLD